MQGRDRERDMLMDEKLTDTSPHFFLSQEVTATNCCRVATCFYFQLRANEQRVHSHNSVSKFRTRSENSAWSTGKPLWLIYTECGYAMQPAGPAAVLIQRVSVTYQ